MQRVIEQPLVRIRVYAEHVAHAFNLGGGPRQEMPIGSVGAPLRGVFSQNLRRVVRGIERDGQQHQIPTEIALKAFLKRVEIVREAKAEIRERTARVDEVYGEELAAEIGEPDALPLLIRQRKV